MKNVQHKAIESGFLDLLGEQKTNTVKLDDTVNTLVQLAGLYVSMITENIEKKDVASSGALSDSIDPTEISINGTRYEIGIKAKKYATFQDEGVNGWAKNRGSAISFKTKGVDPKGDFVKSVKSWLQREGKSARNVKVGISPREKRGMDALTKNAVSVAYMIKRQGIKKTNFWRDATKEMEVYIKNEFGAALKIDIINNLT